MTGASEVTCYPGMGCDQGDCATHPRCYTGSFALSEPVLTETQCTQLGMRDGAHTAARAAAWARAYGPFTDDQRDRLRAVLHPHGNRG